MFFLCYSVIIAYYEDHKELTNMTGILVKETSSINYAIKKKQGRVFKNLSHQNQILFLFSLLQVIHMLDLEMCLNQFKKQEIEERKKRTTNNFRTAIPVES